MILLAMKPEMSPRTIQAIIDMASPSVVAREGAVRISEPTPRGA
jgi:hypothetical protein